MYGGEQIAAFWHVPSRRVSESIHKLCAQAVSVSDPNFAEVLSELRMALHEHTTRTRMMAVRQLFGRRSESWLRKTEER